MSNKISNPVAVLTKQDIERMRKKSATTLSPEQVKQQLQKDLKITHHTPQPVVRKQPLPKSLEQIEADREIISRAELAKQEELAEIRKANRIILMAKCNLIRGAQIAEKQELKRELSQEESRFDLMMAKEREEELKRVEEENSKRQQMNNQHMETIKKQLESRAEDRQRQADKIRAEAAYLASLEAKLKANKDQEQKQKEIRRNKLKRDLQEAHEMNQRMKTAHFEKERLAELKVQEYMRQKNRREEAQEAERRLQNELRERKMMRMCLEQSQAKNSRDEKYEKWFHREAERKERQFREKELEAARKRQKFEEAILKDRQMQQKEKQRLLEVEKRRQEEEYEKNLQILKEGLKRDKEMDCSREKKKEYCELIRDQMRTKEQERQMERIKARNDLREVQLREQQRQENIERMLSKKVKELKLGQVPDNLVKEVERRLKGLTSE